MNFIERLRGKTQPEKLEVLYLPIEQDSLENRVIDKCSIELRKGFMLEGVDLDPGEEEKSEYIQYKVILSDGKMYYYVWRLTERFQAETYIKTLAIQAHSSIPPARSQAKWVAEFWPNIEERWSIKNRTGRNPRILFQEFMEASFDSLATQQFFEHSKREDHQDELGTQSTRWPRLKPEN